MPGTGGCGLPKRLAQHYQEPLFCCVSRTASPPRSQPPGLGTTRCQVRASLSIRYAALTFGEILACALKQDCGCGAPLRGKEEAFKARGASAGGVTWRGSGTHKLRLPLIGLAISGMLAIAPLLASVLARCRI